MKRLITICLALALPVCAQNTPAEKLAGPDMLRFSEKAKHDTIHGKYVSFGEAGTVIFQSPEAKDPIKFNTKNLHRITLDNGRAKQSLAPASSVTLINGDIIPGEIVQADGKTVIIATEHMGQITLASDAVSLISPTPHGGKLHYYGPLPNDGWKTMKSPTGDKKPEEKNDEAKKEAPKKETDWELVAGAWYAGTSKTSTLARNNTLPDKCSLKFRLEWRGTMYCNVALHADMKPPKYDGAESSSLNSRMGSIVGKSYMLTISSHSATLYNYTFDEAGKPVATRVGQQNASIRLSGKSKADIELRIDKENKAMMLFVDGQFKIKWDLGEKYEGPGSALAFYNTRYSNSEMRISEILVSDWNGLRDTANSMQTADRDVILLTNGLDRFSGEFKQIRDGKVSFRGGFNNDITIPLSEVQEIHIASNRVRKLADDAENNSVYFYLQPFGRISGIPTADKAGRTKIQSDIVGNLNLDMKFVSIIDFSHKNSLLDFWNDNF